MQLNCNYYFVLHFFVLYYLYFNENNTKLTQIIGTNTQKEQYKHENQDFLFQFSLIIHYIIIYKDFGDRITEKNWESKKKVLSFILNTIELIDRIFFKNEMQ